MNTTNGHIRLKGNLSMKVIRHPKASLMWRIRNFFRLQYIKSLFGIFVVAPISRIFGIMVGYGSLSILVKKLDGSYVNYGIVSYRLVTTAFINFVVDQLQAESSIFGDFKYHDSGVGTTAENVSNTAIETTDGEARVAGTQIEGAQTYIYRSVGTITYSTAKNISEHGLFNDLTAGTLMDRSVFTAVPMAIGEAITFTYDLTLAGS